MRVYVLYMLIAVLAVYAWRDWFKALCGLVVLTAIMGHPDTPREVLGIVGLNPWNLLLVAILIPWVVSHNRAENPWDLPVGARWILGLYVAVVLVAYVRAALDLDAFRQIGTDAGRNISFGSLTADYLINPLKYMVVALLLYDGCRTRRNTELGLAVVLMMAVIYSTVIVRTVPISGLRATGQAELKHRARIGKRVGFHANSAAMICVAGFWGILAASGLPRRWVVRGVMWAAALVVLLALLLCRSRAGYVALAGVGVVYAVFLWRWALLVLPVMAVTVLVAVPGVSQRLLMGVDTEDPTGQATPDIDTVTAGRMTDIWPPVIDQICESPLLGYGRLGLLRTPASARIEGRMGVSPTHPHNAYLEVLLDSGVLGGVVMGVFYGGLFWMSLSLARDRSDPLFVMCGAASLSAVSAILIMGLSGQTFFPKENAQMGLWLCALAMRAWVERVTLRCAQPGRVRAELDGVEQVCR